MRRDFTLYLLILIFSGVVISKTSIKCPEERPEICTKEYIPVCGYSDKSHACVLPPCNKTYGNKCEACADKSVKRYTDGKCSPKHILRKCNGKKHKKKNDDKHKNATMCPKVRPDLCFEVYEPVCGLFDPNIIACIREPCGQTYGNSCKACADKKVWKYLPGKCEDLQINNR